MLGTFAAVAAAGLGPAGNGDAVHRETRPVRVVSRLENAQVGMVPNQESIDRRSLHLHIRLGGSKASVHCRGTRLNFELLRMRTTSEKSVIVVIRMARVPILVYHSDPRYGRSVSQSAC